MFDIVFTIMFFAVLGVMAVGFFEWMEKIQLEKEHLENLIKEQKDNKNTLRKGLK